MAITLPGTGDESQFIGSIWLPAPSPRRELQKGPVVEHLNPGLSCLRCSNERLGHPGGVDGAPGGWHQEGDEAADAFGRTEIAAVAPQEGRPGDGKGRESQPDQFLLGFPFDAAIEDLRVRPGLQGRNRKEVAGAAGPGQTGDGEHGVMIDRAHEGFVGFHPNRGAEAAEDVVDLEQVPAFFGIGEVELADLHPRQIELHGAPHQSANFGHARRRRKLAHQLTAHQTGRPGHRYHQPCVAHPSSAGNPTRSRAKGCYDASKTSGKRRPRVTKKRFLGLAILSLVAVGSWWLTSPPAKAARKPASPLHERELQNLSRGEARKIDDRVRHIGNMIQEAPNDPVLHSALAAAHFDRAQLADDPRNLIWALESALVATELDAELPEARFYQAAALSELGLRQEGLAAYDAYLAIEVDPAKRQQASQRKQELFARGARSPLELEKELVKVIEGDGDVEGFARRELPVAQSFAIERLPKRLGEAMIAGNEQEKERWLQALEAIGKVAAEVGGDPFLAEVAGSLERANPGAELGQALVDFARAVELYGARETEKAAQLLFLAGERFERERIPLHHWASYLLLACSYFAAEPDLATRLEGFSAAMASRDYQALEAFTLWLQGLYELDVAKVAESRVHLRRAIDIFKKAQWPESVGFLSLLLSDAAVLEGSTLETWRLLKAAMDATPNFRKLGHLQSIWRTAAEHALALEAHRASLRLADRAVAEGIRAAGVLPLAEALGTRATVLATAGNEAGSEKDFATIDSLLTRLPRGGDLRTEGFLLLARGRTRMQQEPSQRLAELERGIELYRQTETIGLLPELLRLRAGLEVAQGQNRVAEASLTEAARLLESQDFGALSLTERARLLETARLVFEDWVRLRAQQRDTAGALAVVERFAVFKKREPANTLAAQPSELPGDVAVIALFALPEKLLVWVGTEGGLELEEVAVPRKDLEATLSSLRQKLGSRGGSRAEVLEISGRVWQLIIGPFESKIAQRRRLIFVVDAFVGSLPAAALADQSGRFLLENHTIEVAPQWPGIGPEKSPMARNTAMIVGNPAFDQEEFPPSDFKDLPEAAQEARQVAGLYPSPDLQLAEAATVAAFFRGLAAKPAVLHVASHLAWRSRAGEIPQLLLTKDDAGGTLTAEQLEASGLEAPPLVYLAACDSAVRGTEKSKRVPSMAEVFLSRGAKAVIGSTIALGDTKAVVRLAKEFHEKYRNGGEPREILRELQLSRLKAASKGPPWWCALQVQIATVPGRE